MLSRVAERFYWIARYLERAENTARLTTVYHNMLLDLPSGVPLSGRQLIDITGSYEIFSQHYKKVTDRNVYSFLLANRDNPGSIYTSISMARENVRTVRDQMPSDAWENVNELYLFAKKRFTSQSYHKTLFKDMSDVIFRCQQITGLLAGTMSHGPGYQFIRLGRNLERGDMTTRILDAGALTMAGIDEQMEPLRNRLWMEVLRSLSSYQMYRQNVRFRIEGQRVIEYLLTNEEFPRAVKHCVSEMENCINLLPNNKKPIKQIHSVKQFLSRRHIVSRARTDLHEYIDELQLRLANQHSGIVANWFEL